MSAANGFGMIHVTLDKTERPRVGSIGKRPDGGWYVSLFTSGKRWVDLPWRYRTYQEANRAFHRMADERQEPGI